VIRCPGRLVAIVVLLGCASDDGRGRVAGRPTVAPVESAPPMVDSATPPLLLELAVTETGERYRVAEDGRYLVTGPDGVERETAPMSRSEQGTRRLTPRALGRLREAIAKVGFSALPDTVPGIATLPAGMRPTGGGQLHPRTFVFTVHAGAPKSVAVLADGRLARSFGALAPLWRALDDEALGGWRNE